MGSPIYTTGDGRDKQYARREDGVWFCRQYRPEIPGWGKWLISTNQHPIGLYRAARFGNAKLPTSELSS